MPAKTVQVDGETFHTVAEAARLLGCARETLYRAIHAGKVRVSARVGVRRVSGTEIRRVLEGSTVPTQPVDMSQSRRVDRAMTELRAAGWA